MLAVAVIGTGFLADAYGHVITAGHLIDEFRTMPQKIMALPVGPDGPIDSTSVGVELQIGISFRETNVRNSADAPRHGLGFGNEPVVPLALRSATLDSSLPIAGEMIATSGYPLNVSSMVTTFGWVASGYIVDPQNLRVLILLGSIPINHGNSGGPVYRIRDGVVIGIAKGFWNAPVEPLGTGDSNSGIGVITPISQAMELLPKQ